MRCQPLLPAIAWRESRPLNDDQPGAVSAGQAFYNQAAEVCWSVDDEIASSLSQARRFGRSHIQLDFLSGFYPAVIPTIGNNPVRGICREFCREFSKEAVQQLFFLPATRSGKFDIDSPADNVRVLLRDNRTGSQHGCFLRAEHLCASYLLHVV